MEISASSVKELRERTGVGFMDCKKALQEAEGDLDGAIKILRTMGKAKAAKYEGPILFVKGDKKTNYGRVRVVMEWIKEINIQDVALVVDVGA